MLRLRCCVVTAFDVYAFTLLHLRCVYVVTFTFVYDFDLIHTFTLLGVVTLELHFDCLRDDGPHVYVTLYTRYVVVRLFCLLITLGVTFVDLVAARCLLRVDYLDCVVARVIAHVCCGTVDLFCLFCC